MLEYLVQYIGMILRTGAGHVQYRLKVNLTLYVNALNSQKFAP
jgi:hypothetical protein